MRKLSRRREISTRGPLSLCADDENTDKFIASKFSEVLERENWLYSFIGQRLPFHGMFPRLKTKRKREENDRRRKRRRSKPAFAFTVTYEEEGEDPVDGLTLPFYSEEAPLEPRNNWTVNQEYMHVHVIVVEHIILHNNKH